MTSEEGDRRIAGHAAVTEKVCLDPSVADLTAYDAQGRVAYSRDIQENVAGLGCRRTVTARSLRLVRGSIIHASPNSALRAPQGGVKISRAPRLCCTSADFGGVSEIAHLALSFARGAEKRLRTLLVF